MFGVGWENNALGKASCSASGELSMQAHKMHTHCMDTPHTPHINTIGKCNQHIRARHPSLGAHHVKGFREYARANHDHAPLMCFLAWSIHAVLQPIAAAWPQSQPAWFASCASTNNDIGMPSSYSCLPPRHSQPRIGAARGTRRRRLGKRDDPRIIVSITSD